MSAWQRRRLTSVSRSRRPFCRSSTEPSTLAFSWLPAPSSTSSATAAAFSRSTLLCAASTLRLISEISSSTVESTCSEQNPGIQQ